MKNYVSFNITYKCDTTNKHDYKIMTQFTVRHYTRNKIYYTCKILKDTIHPISERLGYLVMIKLLINFVKEFIHRTFAW